MKALTNEIWAPSELAASLRAPGVVILWHGLRETYTLLVKSKTRAGPVTTQLKLMERANAMVLGCEVRRGSSALCVQRNCEDCTNEGNCWRLMLLAVVMRPI